MTSSWFYVFVFSLFFLKLLIYIIFLFLFHCFLIIFMLDVDIYIYIDHKYWWQIYIHMSNNKLSINSHRIIKMLVYTINFIIKYINLNPWTFFKHFHELYMLLLMCMHGYFWTLSWSMLIKLIADKFK